MKTANEHAKLLNVRDGFLVCPMCRRNKRLLHIYPETEGRQIAVYCRDCKRELRVDISKGRCFESQSQRAQ